MRSLRNNQAVSVILGVVLAIIAGVMVFVIIQSQAPTVPVVVAVRNINIGEEITEENIDVQNFPASMVPGGALQEEDQAIGMKVSYGPVIKGAMVFQANVSHTGSLRSMLTAYAPVGGDRDMKTELTTGEWAALEISADNGIRGLQKGDFVDIYGERPVAPDSIDVGVIVPHALVIEVPTEKYPRYTLAVEQKYLEAAAEITVRKMNVAVTMSSRQPVVVKDGQDINLETLNPGDTSETAFTDIVSGDSH